MILYLAGDKPAVAKELVSQRIAAETAQVKKLFGFKFMLPGADGKPAHEVSTNEIDHVLREEKDLGKRGRGETSKRSARRSRTASPTCSGCAAVALGYPTSSRTWSRRST